MKKMMLVLTGLAFMIASCSRDVGRGFPKTTVYQPLREKKSSGKIPTYKPPKWKGNDRPGLIYKYKRY